MRNLVLLAALIILPISVQAKIVTITFDGLTPDNPIPAGHGGMDWYFNWSAVEVDGIVYGSYGSDNNSLNRFQLTGGSQSETVVDGYFNLLSIRMRTVNLQPQNDVWWGLDAYGVNSNDVVSDSFFTPQDGVVREYTLDGYTDRRWVVMRLWSGNSPPVYIESITYETASTVPIPAAVWLFGTGLLGLIGIARK